MSLRTPAIPRLLDAGSDLFLGGSFLATWIAPDWMGVNQIRGFLLLMLLEFIVVHSTPFMGMAAMARVDRWQRVKTILGFGLFYTLFVAGFALGFKTWWPIIGFWGLTLNRSLGAVLNPDQGGNERLAIRRSWAATAMAYLGAVTLTTFLPVPALGLTPTLIAEANIPMSGLWVEQPQRLLAAGTAYYLVIGFSRLWDHRWISMRSLPSEATQAREVMGRSVE